MSDIQHLEHLLYKERQAHEETREKLTNTVWELRTAKSKLAEFEATRARSYDIGIASGGHIEGYIEQVVYDEDCAELSSALDAALGALDEIAIDVTASTEGLTHTAYEAAREIRSPKVK